MLRSGENARAAESAARNAIFEWLLACPTPLSPDVRRRVLQAFLDGAVGSEG
jgi:hypothetical protein